MMNDGELLRAYVRDRSDDAFRELVRRHTGLVYSCARQQLRDAHAAEDVTQSVFLALAIKAPKLPPATILAGWLYRATWFAAADYRRREQHRREREMKAHQDQDQGRHNAEADTAAAWQEIQPHLHEALNGLTEADRNAVLLRFYERANYRDMAATLSVTEEAAKKRVQRALDRLRRFFGRKGIGLTVGALTATLGAQAAEAVPSALAAHAAQTALAGAGGAAVATSTLTLAQGTLKAMFIAKVKTVSLTTAACLVIAGSAVVVVAAKQKEDATAKPSASAAVKPSATNQPTATLPAAPSPGVATAAAPTSRESCAGPWLRRAAQEAAGVSDARDRLFLFGDITRSWAQLGNVGEFNAALQSLEQMDSVSGKKEPRSSDTYRYGGVLLLIPQLVREGKIAEATQLCEGVVDRYRAGANKTLAQELAKDGHVAEARAIADKFTGAEANNIQFAIAMGLAKAGQTDEVLATAKTIQPPLQNTVYNALVIAQARQGDYAAARQTIQNTPEAARELVCLSLYSEQLRRGDFDGAKETLAAIPSKERRERTNLDYCFALIKNDRLGEAKAAALAMVGQAQELPAFNLVFREMIRRGDEAGAAAFREKMSANLRERAAKDLRYYLVKSAADAGDTPRAVRNLEALPAAERSFSAYMTVAGALAEAKDTAAARRYMALAKEAAKQVSTNQPPMRFYRPLAFQMAKSGDVEAALQLAREVPEDQGRGETLAGAAKGCLDAENFAQAQAIIQTMPDGNSRVGTARMLGYKAALAGRWTELTGWIDALPGPHERARACIGIAEACLGLTKEQAGTEPGGVGDSYRVFRPIDTTQPGFYAIESWTYTIEVKGDGPVRGLLKYDSRELSAVGEGDFIRTPWGWMQWQEETSWLPVDKKPTTGNQMPDPGGE